MVQTRLIKIAYILLLVLLAIFLSLNLLQYANPMLYPPGRDGGAYMYGGRTVLHGQTLYVDYWEAKGPMIIFINAFGLLLGGDSRWGVWLMEFLFWFFSVILAVFTLKRQYNLASALFGTVTMMMIGKILVGAGNFSEEYSLLFTWVAVTSFFYGLRKPTAKVFPILIGSMFALNFFTRANNIVTSGLLIIIWLLGTLRKKEIKSLLKSAILVFAGGCIVAIPISLYFLIQGTFIDMINASIVYNFSYSFGTQPDANNLNIIKSSFLPALSDIGFWMVFPLIGFAIALVQLIKRSFARQFDPISLLMVLIWPAEMLASSVSGRSYGHYFLLWLPAVAILSAAALNFGLGPIERLLTNKTRPNWASVGLLFVVTALITLFSYSQLAQYGNALAKLALRNTEELTYIQPISAFIAENTDPDDLILVWGGQTGLLFMANRHSSTAYNFYPLYANSRLGRRIQQDYFEDLQRNKPKLIVDASIHAPDSLPSIDPDSRAVQRLIYPIANNHAEVLEYINAHYGLIYELDGYQVYQIFEP
jgi:hypothetical protein